MRWFLMAVAVILFACGGSDDGAACTDAEVARLNVLAREGAYAEYNAAYGRAKQADRSELQPLIADIERIRDDFMAEDWDGCGAEIQQHFTASINANIDGFKAFAADAPDTTVQEHFRRATTEYTTANTLLTNLGQ